MLTILKPFLATAVTILLLAWLLPTVSYSSWTALIFASIVLTLGNQVAKPVLKILFLPLTIVTFGLFSLFLNIAILWFTTYFVPGFQIQAMSISGIDFNLFFSLIITSAIIGLIHGLVRIFI